MAKDKKSVHFQHFYLALMEWSGQQFFFYPAVCIPRRETV